MFKNRKVSEVNQITLEECIYFASQGMYIIVGDGKIKGFKRFNNEK